MTVPAACHLIMEKFGMSFFFKYSLNKQNVSSRCQNRILKGFEHEVGPLVCEIPTMPTDFPQGTLVRAFVF